MLVSFSQHIGIIRLFCLPGGIIKFFSTWENQPSKFTSAVGNYWGFCWSIISNHLIAIVIISTKILLRWLFPSKIYIQFKIFNTYFSTKLSFTNKIYHLHVLGKCLYVLQGVRSIIYFWKFIHSPSLMFLNSFFHLIFFRSRTRCYSLDIMLKCSHKYDLVRKKRVCQSFDVCPRQHSHNSYLMIVLVRAVLTAKLVLRYKHKFETILKVLSQNWVPTNCFLIVLNNLRFLG